MKDDASSIGRLFALSRDPVVCERGGVVTNMNPSAVTLFGGDLTGHPVSELLPETVLFVDSDPFIAAAEIAGMPVTVSCAGFDAYRLYSFIIPETREEKPVELPFSISIREITNTIKVTAEQLMNLSEQYHDEKMDRYAAVLKHSASKLKRLVSNYSLLTACIRGTQPFRPAMVSINRLCAMVVEAVSDLADAHGITLEFVSEGEVLASADPELLRVMLLNLLSNSLISTPSGGHIQVSLRATAAQISITVTDNGRGIPAQDLATIFSRYSQPVRLSDGQVSAGLGLAVAERIAKLHSGTIVIQSVQGKGTTIAARLKRKSDASLMAPWAGYQSSLADSVMTELSTWLGWEDYLMNFED